MSITKDEVINVLIRNLEKNNIFSAHMTIESIKAKLNEKVKEVVVEDLSAREMLGYYRISLNKLAIDETLFNSGDSKNIETVIIHELLHALSTMDIHITGLDRYEGGTGLNEGITEWLSKKIYPTGQNFLFTYGEGAIKFNHCGSYPMEQIAIKQLAILYGEENIIGAYLNNGQLEMPARQFRNLRDNFDFITGKDSYICNISRGRNEQELNNEERDEIKAAQESIADVFIKSQEYFLTECLDLEIDNMSTIQQAEMLKEKLKQLNALRVEIKENEKANYEKYNFKFIRKYLEIINKGRATREQIQFNEVEEYIMGNQELTIENESFFAKISKGISKLRDNIKSRFTKEQTEFIPIDRGREGVLYIRECGEEKIAGEVVKHYQYLTEQEYAEWMRGNKEYKGQILRGDINLKKLQRDNSYMEAVGKKLLTNDRIDDKIVNYGGYIGYVQDGRKQRDDHVQKRLQSEVRFVPININGYDEKMYIVEEGKSKIEGDREFVILTREEIITYRQTVNAEERKNIGIHVRGDIDLTRLETDKDYKEFVEKHLLRRTRVEEKIENYNGYIGEVRGSGKNLCKSVVPSINEKYAKTGANGEEKFVQSDGTIWYVKELASIGEQDDKGNEIYKYEIIDSEQMHYMRFGSGDSHDKEDNRLIMTSTKEDLEQLQDCYVPSVIMDYGSCLSASDYRRSAMGKKVRIYHANNNRVIGRIFEQNGGIYFAGDNSIYIGCWDCAFAERVKIGGNIDLARVRDDPEYARFIKEHVLTLENCLQVKNGSIKGFEISENDGDFVVQTIENKRELAKDGIDR